MTKTRVPESIEDALIQAESFVTRARVAAFIGKSAALVQKFGDPDTDHHLQLRQALEIDRCLALEGWPQPFAQLFVARAERNAVSSRQLGRALASEERPMQMAAAAVRDAAKIVGDLELAEADGVYTATEVDRLLRQLTTLQKRVADLRQGVARKARKA